MKKILKTEKWFTTIGNDFVECDTWKKLGEANSENAKKLQANGWQWKM